MSVELEVKHCTLDDIGMDITGEGSQPVVDACNRYLHDFAGTTCPKCGSKLGGLMGSFTFGLAWGEGFCTGGLTGEKCGWPCRGYHVPKDEAGEKIFEQPLPIVLAYHPSVVESR